MTIGVVLAAGSGTRFGQPKAPVVVDGERLVDRAVRVLHEGGCDPVLVVLGAWQGDVPDAEVVINADWATGMGSSLRVGIEAVLDSNADRAVITLVDLPGLSPAAVARLVATTSNAAAATYDGVRGHPVLLGREHWAPVAASAHGDSGARDYLSALGDALTLVEVGDVAIMDDLDFDPSVESRRSQPE